MRLSDRFTLGVNLALALIVLTVLFAVVVALTVRDAHRLRERVQAAIDQQNRVNQRAVNRWYERVVDEHARQLAAPFLWDIESLEGIAEGTPSFERLQRRMWQFVYGKDEAPAWSQAPIGPLESVVIVNLDHRIVASSDPMRVEMRYRDPEQIEIFRAALSDPQIRWLPDEREDDKPVAEVTLAVPNAAGEPIGFIRMRYVGGNIGDPPRLPRVPVRTEPSFIGPILAGLIAVLGVAFGGYATWHVFALNRRLAAMAEGVRLPPARVPGAPALSVIEERLESLHDAVRRDDLFVASLSEALREGVVLLDPRGRLVLANRQALDSLGLSAHGEQERAACFDRIVAQSPALAEVVRQGLDTRHPVREQPIEVAIEGGRSTTLHVTTYVLADGETPSGLMLVLKDRESIARLERTLREASRLRTIAVLTGSVAHEVKNPLGAIAIHLEHLRRRVTRKDDPDPALAERVGVLRSEIDRLREILEEWLGFTAPEERSTGPADLSEVIDSVERLLRVESRHQAVELVVEKGEGLALAPIAPQRLRQVLLNLALNALQAMPHGGRLTIRARQAQAIAAIEVEDTGHGIEESIRDRVFDYHITTREGGSGLGLAICRRIVEDAGGIITFVTETGRGTTFRVVLPVGPREGVPAGRTASTPPPPSVRRSGPEAPS